MTVLQPATRGAINILWLHFWSAVMSVIIIYSRWSGPQRWAMCRAMLPEWLKSLCLLAALDARLNGCLCLCVLTDGNLSVVDPATGG